MPHPFWDPAARLSGWFPTGIDWGRHQSHLRDWENYIMLIEFYQLFSVHRFDRFSRSCMSVRWAVGILLPHHEVHIRATGVRCNGNRETWELFTSGSCDQSRSAGGEVPGRRNAVRQLIPQNEVNSSKATGYVVLGRSYAALFRRRYPTPETPRILASNRRKVAGSGTRHCQ